MKFRAVGPYETKRVSKRQKFDADITLTMYVAELSSVSIRPWVIEYREKK